MTEPPTENGAPPAGRRDDTTLMRTAALLVEGQSPADADYAELRRYLIRLTTRRTSHGVAEAEDIVDEALTRFLAAAARDSIDRSSALPYLIRIVQNEIIDRRRKRRNTVSEPFEDRPLTDDAIARLVESTATATVLEAALTLAARDGDAVCTCVVNEWLREAEQQGAKPSSREVARRAGVSHVTVQKALRRLRRYVQEVSESCPDDPDDC